MKKVLSVLLAAAMTATSVSALVACTPRDQILRVYNWGDYIDKGLIGDFENWYNKETGDKIKVEYKTFLTNEDMVNEIDMQHIDYDLVCPSDYMAENMIKGKLAQKIDKSIFSMNDDAGGSIFYDGLAKMITPFDSGNEYYVPYIWGTIGIMYDTTYVDAGSDKMKTWEALWSNAHKEKILMKDSVRDAYSIAQIYRNRDKLSQLSNGFTDYNEAYRKELNGYFETINETLIKNAEATLMEQRGLLVGYEVDDGKSNMVNGTTTAKLGMFWSCDAGLIMQDDGGDKFYFDIPKEGSNVWVDGWIIPKYAANVKGANYFLKFLNIHEYARKNFDYLNTTLAVKSVMTEVKAELDADDGSDEDSIFNGKEDWFKPMYMSMMFPSTDVINRCGVMRGYTMEMNKSLSEMWATVRRGMK